jgi:thiol-disulfide isomerase/thioredoxin
MNEFFKKYGIIFLLALLIPIVFLSEDNLINKTFRKILNQNSKRPIIESSNKLPEMSFRILQIEKDSGGQKEIFSTKEMIGQKYILHFFASWCGHCSGEHISFLDLQNQIPIYGIAWRDTPENIRGMISLLGNPYREILLDPFGSQSSALNITGIPLTIIIDSKGSVVFGRMGPIEPKELLEEFKKIEN